MEFPRFVLIKRALLLVALLLVVNPVFAKPEEWKVFSDPSLFKQALSTDQKTGSTRFVVVFVADWSINSISLKRKFFSLDTRGFPGYSFLVFDVSQNRTDQLQLLHLYGGKDSVDSVPVVVVLNRDMKTVPGKRVGRDIWKNTEDLAEWLRSDTGGKVNDGREAAAIPDNFHAVVGVQTSQSADYLSMKLDIPQGFYLLYDRISLRLGSIQINKDAMGSACSSVVKNDPYFGGARM